LTIWIRLTREMTGNMEVISRRELFKKVTKALPVLAMCVSPLLATFASEMKTSGCNSNCEGLCSKECQSTCRRMCHDNCTSSCAVRCGHTCASDCTSRCAASCAYTCKETCVSTCLATCQGSAKYENPDTIKHITDFQSE